MRPPPSYLCIYKVCYETKKSPWSQTTVIVVKQIVLVRSRPENNVLLMLEKFKDRIERNSFASTFNHIKVTLIIILPFNLVHLWFFPVSHRNWRKRWVDYWGGGGGGAKGMLPLPSEIMGGGAGPPAPTPLFLRLRTRRRDISGLKYWWALILDHRPISHSFTCKKSEFWWAFLHFHGPFGRNDGPTNP